MANTARDLTRSETKISPQIRWNRLTSDDPGRVQWYFVVVNRPDRIETYLNRIYGLLENVEIDSEIEGAVRDENDLHYKLVVLKSRKGEINWGEIYRSGTNGKIIHDEELRPRTRENNGLENYVARLLG